MRQMAASQPLKEERRAPMTIDHAMWLVVWGAVAGLSLRCLSILSRRWFGVGYSPVEWQVVAGFTAFFLAGFGIVADWRQSAVVVSVAVVGSFLRKLLVHRARTERATGSSATEGQDDR